MIQALRPVPSPVLRLPSHPLRYQVWHTITATGPENVSHVLTSDLTVSPVTDAAPKPNTHCVEIRRQHRRLDHADTHEAFHHVLLLSASALDRLVCRLDYRGNLLQVENIADIRHRWKAVRALVLAQYSGEVVEQYLDDMAQHLADVPTLMQALRKDFLLTVYFNDLYEPFHLRSHQDGHVALYDLLPTQPVGCPLTKRIRADGDDLDLSQEGYALLKEGWQPETTAFFEESLGLQAPFPPAVVKCQGSYRLSAADGTVRSAVFEASLTMGTHYSKRMRLEMEPMTHDTTEEA